MFENWKQKALAFGLFSAVVAAISAINLSLHSTEKLASKIGIYVAVDFAVALVMIFVLLAVSDFVIGFLKRQFKINLPSRYIAAAIFPFAIAVLLMVALKFFEIMGHPQALASVFLPEQILMTIIMLIIESLVALAIYFACDYVSAFILGKFSVKAVEKKPAKNQ